MKSNANLVWDFNKVFNRAQLNELEDLGSKPEMDKLKSQLALIYEEAQELEDGILESDWEAMKDAVADLLVVTYGMAYVMNIDADKALQRVNEANMSKLCTSQDEVVATTGFYAQLGVEISVQTVGKSLFAIKSTRDQEGEDGKFYPQGKFLKNVNWKEPDLFGIEK